MRRASALLSLMLLMLVGLVAVGRPGLGAVAQSGTPVALPLTAESLLPPPGVLGPDWSLIGASHSDLTSTGFTSVASAMYGGPAGLRVFARVFVVAPGATAARQGWGAANDAFTGLRALVREAPSSGGCSPGDQRKPAGYLEVRRADGQDANFPDFPAGVALCAADPDLIVLIGVFGSFDGRSDFRASDAVLDTIIQGQAAATPTPPAPGLRRPPLASGGSGYTRSDRSHQAEPVRSRQGMPSTTIRWSLAGRPVPGFCAGGGARAPSFADRSVLGLASDRSTPLNTCSNRRPMTLDHSS
jgi:hypothetical protein